MALLFWRSRVNRATVVLPDEVPVTAEPFVRPTHTAGTGGRPALPLAHLVARPRRPDEPMAPARSRSRR